MIISNQPPVTATTKETLRKFRIILVAFSVVFLLMEAQALSLSSHYKYDVLMCMALLAGAYHLRQRLHLYWPHYLLFAVFLVIHALGMYELYSTYPLGIEYDYWVHGIFGFSAGLISMRYFKITQPQLSRASRWLLIAILILGIAAAHELYEFAGALLLGAGDGVLFIGAGDLDQWDTQKDMLNNLIGSLVAIALYELRILMKSD